MSVQLDGLKARIQALRAKTVDNGCTESEALSAAAKVAELLDRYDLSLSDVEIREAACEQRAFETYRKKRMPLDGCVGAIAHFCDCRVWREKNAAGEARYVFFGLRSDVEVAHYMTELIDGAVRSELGRYKTSKAYQKFRHNERHLGELVVHVRHGGVHRRETGGDEGRARRRERRDGACAGGGEDGRRRCRAREARTCACAGRAVTSRMISESAYEAGGAAGASLAINPGLKRA